MWNGIVILTALFIAIAGSVGIIAPARLLQWIRSIDFPALLIPMAGLRIFMGVAIWLAASESRYPTALRVFGAIFILAGLALPVIGGSRIQRVADWWLERPPALIRAWAVAALALGLFLLRAIVGA